MPKRDPRVDPKVGDIVRPRGGFRSFTVLRVDADGCISGRFQSGIRGALCGLSYWRSTFAKDAEVIHPPQASIAPSDDGLAKASPGASTTPDPDADTLTGSRERSRRGETDAG
jgi:hypothetical protein